MALLAFIPKTYFYRLEPQSIYQLTQISKFVNSPFPPKNLIKKYKGLLGPGDSLKSMPIAQFVQADFFYTEYAKNQKQEDLDKFTAVLYQPTNFWGQKKDFEQSLKHLPKVKKLSINFKMYVFLFFTACKKEITETYKNLYEPQEEQQEQTEITHTNWSYILLDIAEKGVFGDFEKTTKTSVHNALAYINKKNLEYEQSAEN